MKSAKEVIDFAKKNNAVMVDLKFIDFLGTWQHLQFLFLISVKKCWKKEGCLMVRVFDVGRPLTAVT